LQPRCIDQRRRPVGHGGDALERGSLGPAMAGKIDREHAAAMVGEPARLQTPGRAVEARAVQEDDGGLGNIEVGAAGRRGDGAAVDGEIHGQAFTAARSAWPRSSRMSAGSSRPTERRIMPSPMPASFSAAASSWAWVVEAGWMTSDLASPTLARCE